MRGFQTNNRKRSNSSLKSGSVRSSNQSTEPSKQTIGAQIDAADAMSLVLALQNHKPWTDIWAAREVPHTNLGTDPHTVTGDTYLSKMMSTDTAISEPYLRAASSKVKDFVARKLPTEKEQQRILDAASLLAPDLAAKRLEKRESHTVFYERRPSDD